MDALNGLASDHAFEELLADGWQERIGEDRIDHPSTAVEFGAAARD